MDLSKGGEKIVRAIFNVHSTAQRVEGQKPGIIPHQIKACRRHSIPNLQKSLNRTGTNGEKISLALGTIFHYPDKEQ